MECDAASLGVRLQTFRDRHLVY